MRWTSFIVVGFLATLVVAGCSRKAAPSTTTIVKDSIRTNVVYRDVEVPVPGETITVTDYIECDSVTNKPIPKNIHAASQGGRARVAVTVSDSGSLTATGGCDSLVAVINAQDSVIHHYRSVEKTEVLPPVIEYRTRWYDKAARVIAIAALVLAFIKLKFLT